VRETDIDLHVHRDLKLTPSQWTAVVGDVTEQARLPGRHDDRSNALVMDALLAATSLRALATHVDAVRRARAHNARTRPRRRRPDAATSWRTRIIDRGEVYNVWRYTLVSRTSKPTRR
jgi:hypothetical protein